MKKNNDFYIASGGVHPELAKDICAENEIGEDHFLETSLKHFKSGELLPKPKESVRGKEVFFVQSFLEGENGYSVNDALMENYLFVDACRRADAAEVTAVWPMMPYARQDRKASGREPISAATVLQLARAAGIHRIVSVDMHAPQSQGAFTGPFNHITAHDLILDNIKGRLYDNWDPAMIVAPDAGALKNNETYAEELKLDVTFMPKKRSVEASSNGLITRDKKLEYVEDQHVFIIDDMIDTGGTLISAAEALKENGAKSVIALATHGLFSNHGAERLADSVIDQVVVTDTIPQSKHKEIMGDKLEVIRIAPLLARTIRRIVDDESVSELFHDQNNK